MAQLNNPFDPNSVPERQSFDIIPPGKYPMIFTASEEKKTKAGTGSFYQLTAQIIDGPLKGRLIWIRLNLNNPNAKAVEIAQLELGEICRAVGFSGQLENTSELHNKPFVGDVKIKAASGGYDASNEIKGFSSTNGQRPPAAQPPTPQPAANDAAQAPAQAAAVGEKSDWWN